MDDTTLESLADCIMEEQKKENTVLPVLKKQLREVQKGIENMLNAIQMGIITPSTKERQEELEREKSYPSIEITKEELSHPKLERDETLNKLQLNAIKSRLDSNYPDGIIGLNPESSIKL